MNTKNIFSMFLILSLTGCATGYGITYNTQPTGASIICSGINHGYSPVRLNYNPSESNKRIGSMRTEPCTAIWSSGMRQNYATTWDMNKFPNGVMQTLQRPQGEGYSQDAEFALSVQNMKSQKNAASAATYNAIMQNRPKTTNTNCYGTFGGVNCNSTTY
mgnify:CR=1 FL=1